MKLIKLLLPFIIFGIFFTSCSKDEDPTSGEKPVSENIIVEEFIYRGLNDYYLYKSDVPELANDYFSSLTEKQQFLAGFDSPEDAFESLLAEGDNFSFMFDDYIALEKLLAGVYKTSGIDYGFGGFSNSDGLFFYVRYIMPGTSAEEMGVERGDIFTVVDGVSLTESNWEELLGQDSYTITLATIANNTISQTNETITLQNTEYDEDPIYIAKVIEQDGAKIGYLMYNGFYSGWDSKLNQTFADFRAAGVTDLVLDLRYNGGGSVLTATRLASMITGQFTGKLFAKQNWNEKWQNIYEAHFPEYLVNKFTDTINAGQPLHSLNLNQVHVITTRSSASASELVLNGLDPYIDVVQVGTTTRGKFQGSVTLYDSPDFNRPGANKNHTYAMQPLVLVVVNSEGKSNYKDGLGPDISLQEDLANMGILGDSSEPLLNAAINDILGNTQKSALRGKTEFPIEMIGESRMHLPNYQKMYIDKLPPLPIDLK